MYKNCDLFCNVIVHWSVNQSISAIGGAHLTPVAYRMSIWLSICVPILIHLTPVQTEANSMGYYEMLMQRLLVSVLSC